MDIAGLINGNIYVSEVTVTETGSVRGSVEASKIEINGHIQKEKLQLTTMVIGKKCGNKR